jgi:hypothetical protein
MMVGAINAFGTRQWDVWIWVSTGVRREPRVSQQQGGEEFPFRVKFGISYFRCIIQGQKPTSTKRKAQEFGLNWCKLTGFVIFY